MHNGKRPEGSPFLKQPTSRQAQGSKISKAAITEAVRLGRNALLDEQGRLTSLSAAA
jgi:hypothetical protein